MAARVDVARPIANSGLYINEQTLEISLYRFVSSYCS
jgi:hypothetical protein